MFIQSRLIRECDEYEGCSSPKRGVPESVNKLISHPSFLKVYEPPQRVGDGQFEPGDGPMVKPEEVCTTPGSVDKSFSTGFFLAFIIASRGRVLGREMISTKLIQHERERLPEVGCDNQRQPTPHFFTTTVNFPDHNYFLRSVQLDFAYKGCLTLHQSRPASI